MNPFEQTGTEIGKLVAAKNKAYGNSFADCGAFLAILYPDGVQPHQFTDALTLVRIFDKMKRIATQKGAFDESPYRDIAGYGILGTVKDASPHCTHQKAPGEDCSIGGVECWQCGDYAEAESTNEGAKSPFVFPPARRFIGQGYSDLDYKAKLEEEVDEVMVELERGDYDDAMVEMFDVVHVMESWMRDVLERYSLTENFARTSADLCQAKNAQRNYYEKPEAPC